jgi:hypothetical protein
MSAVAIVTVLIVLDGRILPVWPLGLTLNGLLSVLSSTAKSALLLPTAEAVGQLKWVQHHMSYLTTALSHADFI